MLLLSLVGVEPEAIVDDYLETVRLGAVGAASIGGVDTEPETEARCRRHGGTTEGAFRDALAGLRIEDVLERSGLADREIRRLRTWRGALP